jgi:hypothetical protein
VPPHGLVSLAFERVWCTERCSMEIISGLLAQTQPKPQSAQDTITKLCDRLSHSTLLEDRRAAVFALKGFSREYRETVAAGGLRGLIQALLQDSGDDETCRACLETLLILFIKSEEGSMEDVERQSRLIRSRNKKYPSPLLIQQQQQQQQQNEEANGPVDYIALWLTDEFTQKEENILAVLDIVQNSTDFYSKLYALQLLAAIISNRPRRAQECIFASTVGISTLVSALDDLRDMVRNEAILVLLNLVGGNSDVQKLVAFEGTFDKLFDIIDTEGGINGSVIVEDCLLLMAHLLQYNVSNQTYFRETNCIPKLDNLLSIVNDPDAQLVWDDQFCSNVTTVLDIIQIFVPEGNEATATNQQALCKSGMLMTVLRLAFGPSTTMQLRSSALLTSAALIKSNKDLQEQFLAIDVPYIDLGVAAERREIQIVPVAQALLNWLLLSVSIHTFDLRVGALVCLEAAFHDNAEEKIAFLNSQISFFRPTDQDQDQLPPPGSANLIAALVDYDADIRLNPYKVWFAAVMLLRLFEDSHEASDTLRAFKLGNEEEGEEVVSVIQSLSTMMTTSLQYQDTRITIAYIMLLSVWLYDDIKAVDDFLEESTTVQALIAVLTHSASPSNSPLVDALSAILLGVVYDFSSSASPIPR